MDVIESSSLMAIAIPTVLAIALQLAKAGFLIWVFIRTQKIWAIGYAVYVVLASLANFIVPAVVTSVSSTDAFTSVQSIFAIYGFVSTLIEVVLFIGLVQSLLKSHRPTVKSLPADG
ncbi:MAG: hypothetical protein AAFP03_10810 [Cyanobacteria bacterium J06598_3]